MNGDNHSRVSLMDRRHEGDYVAMIDYPEFNGKPAGREADRGPGSGRVLVVTSVPAEQEAVVRGIHADSRFDVLAAGVGPVAAAICTAKALARADYALVVNAGIAGGFPNKAEVGSLVVATEIIAADLGAETEKGFSSVDELGFGTARLPVAEALAKKAVEAIHKAGLQAAAAPVLTLSTVTGTANTARLLAEREPDAAAEAMEGYGVGAAAHDQGVPFLEIRAISNLIGPRDRSSWRIPDALKALEAASSALLEVFE